MCTGIFLCVPAPIKFDVLIKTALLYLYLKCVHVTKPVTLPITSKFKFQVAAAAAIDTIWKI